MDEDRRDGERPPDVTQAGRRRTVDVSAGATLVLGLPWFLCSLGVIAAGASTLGPVATVAVVLGWVASGPVALAAPVADMLAMTVFRLSRPTDAEQAYLRSLWEPLTAAARVVGTRYTLWIQESAEVNAYAAGGHIVAVTRWSLQALPPRELAAVLAHELGHHLGGHAWSALLISWYSLPARVVLRCARIVVRLAVALVAFTSLPAFAVAAAVVVVSALVVVRSIPALLLLACIPPVLAFFARQGELRCDRLAAQLGYGPALIEVFQRWAADGHAPRPGLLATHPTVAERVRALEHAMMTRPGSGVDDGGRGAG